MGKKKKMEILKPEPSKTGKYEALLQLIHNAPSEFLRKKWQDALEAVKAREKEHS